MPQAAITLIRSTDSGSRKATKVPFISNWLVSLKFVYFCNYVGLLSPPGSLPHAARVLGGAIVSSIISVPLVEVKYLTSVAVNRCSCY